MKGSKKTGDVVLDPSAIRAINGFDDKKRVTLVDDVSQNSKKSEKRESIYAAWDFDDQDHDRKSSGHVYEVGDEALIC